jgi:DedD protein
VNSLYNNDNDLQDFHETGTPDREISLGTSTVLGIFFVLALICAAFFGFGYSLGRRSAQPAPGTAEAAASGATTYKPAPGSPVSHPAAAPPANSTETEASADAPAPPAQTVAAAATTKPTTSKPGPDTLTAQPATQPTTQPAPIVRQAPPTPTPAPVAAAVPGTPGTAVVQVAAVSHQEDADLLLSALKHQGYKAAIRQEPQDKLLHIQIGPFATKKDAEVIRQKLISDGYNAIVK